jgi:hypothetical protein
MGTDSTDSDIVVGIDGCAGGREALRSAAVEVHRRDARLRILTGGDVMA